ncbi:hypothetical protein AACH06_29865 [Ideonella sp. DXS29W]|uniref:Uncharacterized protein n=1 Tax=Ideonella lacteola TaxID=2984193 RepID=A0ABU9BZ43_9BURK
MSERYGEIEVIPPALDWAPTQPSMFFKSGIPNASEVASQLIWAAKLLGSSDAKLHILNEWFVVTSATDWVSAAAKGPAEHELFVYMRSFPEAGQNEIRPEFVAAAFSKAVVVLGPAGIRVVRGHVEDNDPILEHLSRAPEWKRAVAFRGVGDA